MLTYSNEEMLRVVNPLRERIDMDREVILKLRHTLNMIAAGTTHINSQDILKEAVKVADRALQMPLF